MNTANQTACPRCNAALAPGARFCGACGASMTGAPPPPIPQTPPPIPQAPQMTRGFSGATGGPSKQATFGGAPQDAFNQALRAITASGGEILGQQPPQGARFQLGYKNFWSTMNTTLKYDGELQVAPAGPGQVTARFALKLQWGSVVPLMALLVAVVVIGAMLNPYYYAFGLFIIIVAVAYNAWAASSRIPEKILGDIVKALQSGAPMAGGFTPQPYAPQPAPAPQPFQPQPIQPPPQPAAAPGPAGGGDAASVVEQIKQLAGLRDAGAITPEEFEAKKAELLARI